MKIFIASIKPYSRYRSGQPWAGVVVRKEEFHAAESRYGVDMHAGLFEGSAEQGGRLYVEAEPGDVVAWGQQGIRYNDTGERHGRVRPDGAVETLPDKAAAYRLLDEMAEEAKLAADRPETPVQPVVPEEKPPEPEQNPLAEDSPEDPVQRVVPETAPPESTPQTEQEDPVQPVVPEEQVPEAEPPAAMEGGSEEPVQPVVPEETAPEPEPQAASENQHAEPVRRAVRLAGFAKPMGDPGAEPEYENVVNPFGHD